MVQQTMTAIKQIQRSVTSYENHGSFRWSKPAFQAFQLRPWSRDPEMEESMKNSLAIYGPQVQNEISRAKSVPAREKDPMIDRDDVRTAHSVANMRDLISLKPKSSLEALPIRPPLSKTKQVPGRYFPKATIGEPKKAASFNVFRRYKPPVRARVVAIGNSRSLDTSNLPIESLSFLEAIPRSHRQASPGFSRRIHRPKRQLTEFPEIKSEVFAICFNNTGSARRSADDQNAATEADKPTKLTYDPSSELHSDYYTIKRVNLKTPTPTKAPRSFSVVLRGEPKRLHPKLMFLDESEAFTDRQQKNECESTTSSHVNHKNDADESEKEQKQSVTSGGKINVKIDSGLMPITVNGIS